MNITERKKEIIEICLETFMRDGLINTSMRDLGKALDLDPTALYNHFESKDEVVIACAEEATVRIENNLFGTALKDINDPDKLVKDLDRIAVTMRPLMQFFINVCTSQKYCDKLKEVTVDKLIAYNELTSTNIQVGQKIKIPPTDYEIANTEATAESSPLATEQKTRSTETSAEETSYTTESDTINSNIAN